ncbi:hypothetical protein CR513_30816, partial [Mucuna pruriens]
MKSAGLFSRITDAQLLSTSLQLLFHVNLFLLCIIRSNLEWEQAQSYEHKSRLTHLLPEFHGLVGNTQQFGIKGSLASKMVNELTIGQHNNSPLVKVCGMCASVEHTTNACPTLQEIEPQRYQPPPPFRP